MELSPQFLIIIFQIQLYNWKIKFPISNLSSLLYPMDIKYNFQLNKNNFFINLNKINAIKNEILNVIKILMWLSLNLSLIFMKFLNNPKLDREFTIIKINKKCYTQYCIIPIVIQSLWYSLFLIIKSFVFVFVVLFLNK